MEPSDFFLLYVVLFLFLAALTVAALIIIALKKEQKENPIPNIVAEPSGNMVAPPGNRVTPPGKHKPEDQYQEKRAAVAALRADIDLALNTMERQGSMSPQQCLTAVEQVYQGWLKKNSTLFPETQGKVSLLGKKAGLWSYRLPSELESLVAKLSG
ncbi:hypothetical protein [Bordetella sp. FB-8]|uniref:hypothetical protein n=1 Tax=Bordetella sp. FB-8 TaxID=1159870 RepID=UPI00037DC529|nr:hypothetical protein [Bordetella sp. FB-8]